MAERTKVQLGSRLVDRNIITEAQLNEALALQQKNRKKLGDCLVQLGFASEEDIVNILSFQLNIPRIELRGIQIDPEIIGLVNGSILRRHGVLPVAFDESRSNTLILAMSNPLDMEAQDDISIITNYMIDPRVATMAEINSVLDKHFGNEEAMSAAEKYAKEREDQLVQAAEANAQQQNELNNRSLICFAD